MRHNLPSVPIFRDTPAGSLIEEVALRVVVELPEWDLHIVGTATVIGGHLALTARHVIEEAMKCFKTKSVLGKIGAEGGCLQLLQVLPGPIYRFWRVVSAWITSSDIAILHLSLDRTSEENAKVDWRSLALRATPPPTGEKVVAFGYRQSKVKITRHSNGQ